MVSFYNTEVGTGTVVSGPPVPSEDGRVPILFYWIVGSVLPQSFTIHPSTSKVGVTDHFREVERNPNF